MDSTDRCSADQWRFPAGTLWSGGSRGDNAKGDNTHGTLRLCLPYRFPRAEGAFRGMGEKFLTNPAIDTGSLSFPLYSSLGRLDLGPQLTLFYDLDAGNGPFGRGWSFSLPIITHKTDK